MKTRRFFLAGTGVAIFAAVLSLTIAGGLRAPEVLTMEPQAEADGLFAILAVFAAVTAFLVYLVRHSGGRIIFTVLFSAALAIGVWYYALLYFDEVTAILISGALILTRHIFPRVFIQNLLIIIGVAGIALSIGFSINFVTALLLAVILAIYDIIAVYWTGHMVELMRGLLREGAIFAAVLPEKPHGIGENLKKVHPREGFALLGTGDLAIPAIFTASLLEIGVPAAVFGAAGGFLGFILTTILFLGPDRGKPMPALPPIVLGMVLGFAASLLLKLYG